MDSFASALEAGTVFKFITGIGNFDGDDIRFLAHVYALAGADIIDVAARPDVVAAARGALDEAVGRHPRRRSETAPRLMASLALERDPHVEAAWTPTGHRALVVPADAAALAEHAAACLSAGAEMVELHASDSDDADLAAAVRALSDVLQGRYLSVCLGAEGLRAPRAVVRQAVLAHSIHGPRTMIQAEGIALAKDSSPAASLQGLALAQALLAHTSTRVIVAGGTNFWTRNLVELLGVPVHGIAAGTYARSLVEGFRAPPAGPVDVATAARVARRLTLHAKGADPRDRTPDDEPAPVFWSGLRVAGNVLAEAQPE